MIDAIDPLHRFRLFEQSFQSMLRDHDVRTDMICHETDQHSAERSCDEDARCSAARRSILEDPATPSHFARSRRSSGVPHMIKLQA